MISRHAIALLTTLPLLAAGCKDDEPEVAPIDQLPPATRAGQYTFGCLVNGEAFVPENTNDITAIYQQGVLVIGTDADTENSTQGIVFTLRATEIIAQSYNLIPSFDRGTKFNNAKYDASQNSYTNICRYEYEDLIEGRLTITHFDDDNYIVSGTFEFTTATEGCDTIRVTDGRFDIPYIP